MPLDSATDALRQALAGALLYRVGAGATTRPADPTTTAVAATLVRERDGGDRVALSGVGRWLAATADETEREAARQGQVTEAAAHEATVRRRLVRESGVDLEALQPYGPGGAGDRRRRSPYAGAADGVLLEFVAARAGARTPGIGGGPEVAELADGGRLYERGADRARVSGAALRLQRLYEAAA